MSTTRKLTVRSCDVKYEGTNKNGNPFTLYEVAVVGEDGDPVMEEFKSFDMLPIGDLVAYEVEREDHEQYGVSYLLRLPPGVKAGRKPDVAGAVEALTQRVARLESQVGGVTSEATPAAAVSPALASPATSTPDSDDDIPF